ncbi:uncharacterized protein At1g08160-like [Andrographis paniculata]|uniref:uncharacterized protein At1g08160-like n=1 Tax=Andrographis paniculata TaxID=175694 RepID=UPI0021E7E639|nr:uncharacterized protein At1g08160-like [Andrographis paniculata]
MQRPQSQAALQRQRQRQRHPTPVRYIAGALLTLIIIVGLIVLITWLIVHPKKLKYSIEQGSISGFNLTDSRVNANFHFVLRADNPNHHISLYYDRIDVTVLYEDQKLSVNNVHPFYQRRRNVTHVDLNLVAKDATVYGGVARDLRMEKASGDVVLDVAIRAKIRLKIGVFKIHRKLKVLCRSVTTPFDPSKAKGFKRVWCDADID